MKTGVISDTHGLLRPEALDALAGCELIVHAGDIGKPEIIEALQALAQTLLLHDIADVPAELDEAVRVVITGHSHKPLVDWRQGRLYLNPGSAGPRRFKLPVTVAVIEIEGEHLAPRIIQLLE
jgi:predicted phosphodiesterase